jgi:ABC-type xylose transport system substrate-binding protein
VLEHPTNIAGHRWADDMRLWLNVEQIHVMHYLLNTKACDMKEVLAFNGVFHWGALSALRDQGNDAAHYPSSSPVPARH